MLKHQNPLIERGNVAERAGEKGIDCCLLGAFGAALGRVVIGVFRRESSRQLKLHLEMD